MQPIIDPIDRKILESELTRERFVRITNNGDNEIYIVDCHNSPNTIREIGRLREIAFRQAGGGSGLDCDLDELDLSEIPYQQLIVWNTHDKEIVGGYRYILCEKAPEIDGEIQLATAHLFAFSEKFKKEFLPYTIELGRSFVQPKYQPSAQNRKGLFSMDNLWDGLGALTIDNPHIKYYFGKVTMYRHYNQEARDMILYFMDYYFPDPDKLVWPFHSVPISHDMSAFQKELEGKDYKEGHKILNQHVRELGENIPPLINSYMNTSPTMRNFGTAINEDFGDVEETGILMTITDIYPSKKERHLTSYIPK
jgi:hypothetical protein